MAAISFDKKESLLPVKQILYRFIQTSSTAVLGYLGEKAEETKAVALKILKELTRVNIRCDEPIPMARVPLNLKDLLPPEGLPLPFDFQCKEGYKLEPEGIIVSRRRPGSDKNVTDATISVGPADATFMLGYNKESQTCDVKLRFRGKLPVKIQVGSPAKSVPTAKVMVKLLIDKLGMTSQNVKFIRSISENAQTMVDVVHALLVEGRPVHEAFKMAHTSQLNAEFGQMLGAREVRFISAKNAYPDVVRELEELLEDSQLPEDQLQVFRGQRKLREIQELTGIDLLCDATRLPRSQQPLLPYHVDLVYAVTH